MKLEVTVNLGNYQNVKVESGEHTFSADCVHEIKEYLLFIGVPEADDFVKQYLKE